MSQFLPPKSATPESKLSTTEMEVLILKSAVQMIDNTVNHALLTLHQADPKSEIYPKTSEGKLYFNIVLVDFLSPPDESIADNALSYLEALGKICQRPHFNINSSVDSLSNRIKEFSAWLDKKIVIKGMWFGNINVNVDLQIKRNDFVKISGNISKHNITRTVRQAKLLQKIFKENGRQCLLKTHLLG